MVHIGDDNCKTVKNITFCHLSLNRFPKNFHQAINKQEALVSSMGMRYLYRNTDGQKTAEIEQIGPGTSLLETSKDTEREEADNGHGNSQIDF